jgi:hypothetical protein
VFNNFFFRQSENYGIMSKNMVETEGPKMTSQHGAYELHAEWARLHACTHAHKHKDTLTFITFIAFALQP